MGENTLIQWAHHTFNPWVGCQRVSPGCTNCYAEALDKRFGGALVDGQKVLRWGPKAPRVKTSKSNWKQPLRWNKAAEAAGERHRVFCASLADVFEDRFLIEAYRLELFELIRATPHLDWLLLTKRPENVRKMISAAIDLTVTTPWDTRAVGDWLQDWSNGVAPANVWLGTTVEDQQRADERIPALLEVPAKVRFLSCEPLLERVDLNYPKSLFPDGPAHCCSGFECGCYGKPIDPPLMWGINWVIIGGESGPGARVFALDWARDLVRQCRASGALPFVKQLGAAPNQSQDSALAAAGIFPPDSGALGRRLEPMKLKDSHGGDWDEWPADLRIREVPR